ncbi:hypothetical protein ACJMK2_019880 [Sinanodonta woodiana]|uniref:Fork-head domain-containing protein n=1 Tax=Sinanodonta woodiana TaxID=1069815 RepID=A0ABD3TX86_SINWO
MSQTRRKILMPEEIVTDMHISSHVSRFDGISRVVGHQFHGRIVCDSKSGDKHLFKGNKLGHLNLAERHLRCSEQSCQGEKHNCYKSTKKEKCVFRKKAKRKKGRKKRWTLPAEISDDSDVESNAASCPQETWEQVEARRREIKRKLLTRQEHLLTKEEEEDIHIRAESFAITALPDPEYYILIENDSMPRMPNCENRDEEYPTSGTRKRRRRSYGNYDCFVTSHNKEHVLDSPRMLPIGTRLLKPSTKLVELVAKAIDSSPDNLLQVQQIYTYLQNRYPYFKYMEGASINSWKSSIRHALYQKWFRKIPFDLSYINSKGCYWAINYKHSPKEWSLPFSSSNDSLGNSDDEFPEDYDIDPDTHEAVCALLREEEQEEINTEDPDRLSDQTDIMSIAKEYGISLPSADSNKHVPSPVKELDPILATCVPQNVIISKGTKAYSLYRDHCLQSNRMFNKDCLSSTPSLINIDDGSLPTDVVQRSLQLGTPLPSPKHAQRPDSFIRDSPGNISKGDNSPLVNWTSTFEEPYILSPQQTSKIFFMGYPLRVGDTFNEKTLENCDVSQSFPHPVGQPFQNYWTSPVHRVRDVLLSDGQQEVNYGGAMQNCWSSPSLRSNASSTEFEIIAEFSTNSPCVSCDSLDSYGLIV